MRVIDHVQFGKVFRQIFDGRRVLETNPREFMGG